MSAETRKRGRPPTAGPLAEKRIVVYVTADEFDDVQAAARQAGDTVSTWCRTKIRQAAARAKR